MRIPVLLATTLSVSLLAGCSDAGGGAPELDQAFDDLDLEATATTGLIRGIVVDRAIVPLAGATVELSGQSRTATSDDAGLFGFEGLEAATYFLRVSKPGYVATQQSVDVVAGVAEPTIVKVLLEADPSSVPYLVEHKYTGYIQCSFKVANIVFDSESCDPEGTTGLSANDDSQPWFEVTAPPLFYQSEMIWESTQQAGTGLVTIQFACEQDDCGETDTNRLCNVRGHSPLICRVNRDEAVDSGNGHGLNESGLGDSLKGYSVQMFANCFECVPDTVLGLGVVLEQRFDVFNHLFYGYLPPDGWTFVTDGPPPPPPV